MDPNRAGTGRDGTTAAVWRAPTARSRQWTVRYALCALVGWWLGVGALALALYLAGVHVPDGAAVLGVELAMLVSLVPLYRKDRFSPADLGLRPASGARSVGLVLLGLFAYGWFSRAWTVTVHPPPVRASFPGIGQESTLEVVLAGIAACAGAPIAEEVFFRGVLYRSLRNRLSIAPACIIAALIFGAGHTQYPLLVRPELAFFGVITCLLYERTGSLLPGIALHSLVDASGFEYALTGRVAIVGTVYFLLALVLLARVPVRALRRRRRARARASGQRAIAAAKPALMPLLVACLTVACLGLVASRFGVLSAGANRPAPKAMPCAAAAQAEALSARVPLSEIVQLRASLLPVMARAGGRRYEGGIVVPSDMWSDDSPRAPISARLSSGLWTGGWEIRQWSSVHGNVVADAFVFADQSRAAAFFTRAASTACRRVTRVSPGPVTGSSDLVWTNPDSATQHDVFVLRGELVYRIADVRPAPMTAPVAVEEQRALSTVDALACYLPQVLCARRHD